VLIMIMSFLHQAMAVMIVADGRQPCVREINHQTYESKPRQSGSTPGSENDS
jgi:hypothetical protein